MCWFLLWCVSSFGDVVTHLERWWLVFEIWLANGKEVAYFNFSICAVFLGNALTHWEMGWLIGKWGDSLGNGVTHLELCATWSCDGSFGDAEKDYLIYWLIGRDLMARWEIGWLIRKCCGSLENLMVLWYRWDDSFEGDSLREVLTALGAGFRSRSRPEPGYLAGAGAVTLARLLIVYLFNNSRKLNGT